MWGYAFGYTTSKVLLQCSREEFLSLLSKYMGLTLFLRAFSYRTVCEIILALSAEKRCQPTKRSFWKLPVKCCLQITSTFEMFSKKLYAHLVVCWKCVCTKEKLRLEMV